MPPDASLEHVLVLLDQHATMTLTYAVSCRQHRVTPPLDHLAVDAALWHCPPDGSLDALVRGRVVRPGDQEWDTARAAWNLAVDQRPDLVVEVADPSTVRSMRPPTKRSDSSHPCAGSVR